jgi:hypothetical protein
MPQQQHNWGFLGMCFEEFEVVVIVLASFPLPPYPSFPSPIDPLFDAPCHFSTTTGAIPLQNSAGHLSATPATPHSELAPSLLTRGQTSLTQSKVKRC